MKKETYGNPYRSGEKNIDDLYKKLINDFFERERESEKFEYVFGDVCKIMSELNWAPKNSITVQVAGSLDKDKFIVIKNKNLNPRPTKKSLPENQQKPIIV